MFVDLDSSHDKGLVLNVPKNSHHPTIGDQSLTDMAVLVM